MRASAGRLRRRLSAAAGAIRERRRHRTIRAGSSARGRVAVFYGHDRVPGADDAVHGGMVKFQELARLLPNEPESFNVLYLGSSTLPRDAAALVELARARGAAFVWNQNGVAYPGWHGPGWERTNEPLASGLHSADHVLFQSEFCKLSSDRFLGERSGPSEVLHNPVDTERFTPAAAPPERPTLLLGGNQYQRYRFEVALRTLGLLPDEWRLLVSGRLSWHADQALARREADELVATLGLGQRVELTGDYTQAEAPGLMQFAHVLLHPQYNDSCPTVVLEAMACGLPVVHSASGGTTELVGEEGGIGVPAPLDWQRDHPPAPEELCDAVLEAAARRAELGAAARRRAVERFDLRPWLARHRQLFEELVR